MREYTKYRNSYRFGSEINTFFKMYKKVILFLVIFALGGLVAGIMTASANSSGLALENIPDDILVSFLSGDRGSFGTFFAYAIKYLIIICLIVFLNINTFFSIVNMCYIFVFAYQIGFGLYAIISIYSLAGILNGIVVILPFKLILLVCIVLISALAINKNRLIKKYGCVPYCDNLKNIYLCLIGLFFAILFVWCMILPIIKITIIVNW